MKKPSRLQDSTVAAMSLSQDHDRQEIGEGGGLMLRLFRTRAGVTKQWLVRYRVKLPDVEGVPGKVVQRRLVLGEYRPGHPQHVSVAAARAAALQAVAQAKRGHDPQGAAFAEKAERAAAPTVADLIDRFRHLHLPTLSRRTADDYGRYLERDVRPVLGHLKVRDVSRKHVADLVDAVTERAQQRDRTKVTGAAGAMLKAVLSSLWSFAERKGIADGNPAARVEASVRVRRRENRLSVMPSDRGRGIQGPVGAWLAQLELSGLEPGTKVAAKLCLLMALRADEATSLRVRDVDIEGETLRVQGKRDKERILPLSCPAVRDMLAVQLRRAASAGSEWLFPQKAEPRRHLRHDSLGSAVARVSVLLDMDVTAHDLRRTCATGVRAQDGSTETVRHVLGHVDRDVTDIYDRHTPWTEMRDALSRWSAYARADASRFAEEERAVAVGQV